MARGCRRRCSLRPPSPQPSPAQPPATPQGAKQTQIQRWFEGSLQSCVCCLTCGAESKTYDPFLDLSLELKAEASGATCKSVAEAMRRFTQAEALETGEDGYRCEACGQVGRATKQLQARRRRVCSPST